jgi:hypothetical protein
MVDRGAILYLGGKVNEAEFEYLLQIAYERQVDNEMLVKIYGFLPFVPAPKSWYEGL